MDFRVQRQIGYTTSNMLKKKRKKRSVKGNFSLLPSVTTGNFSHDFGTLDTYGSVFPASLSGP